MKLSERQILKAWKPYQKEIEEVIQELSNGPSNIIKSLQFEKENKHPKFTYLQYLSIERYLQLLLDGSTKMAASQSVAAILFGKQNISSYKATSIRNWTSYFIRHRKLLEFTLSKHRKTFTIIADENVQEILKQSLRIIPINE